MRALHRRTVSLGLLALLAGCGDDDDPFQPTVDTVTGSYTAASFTAETGAGTVDLLALGAEVDVTLAADGTTTGHLFVPGAIIGADDVDEDLAGSWSLAGSTVTFSQSADTFIRDVDFTAGPDRLSAEGVFDGQVISLVLVKTQLEKRER